MKQEIKSVLKKTAKIAGATCIAVGAIAVMTSGVAVRVIGEGGKHLAKTVKRIAKDQSQPQEEILEQEAQEAAAVTEADFAEADETPAQAL